MQLFFFVCKLQSTSLSIGSGNTKLTNPKSSLKHCCRREIASLKTFFHYWNEVLSVLSKESWSRFFQSWDGFLSGNVLCTTIEDVDGHFYWKIHMRAEAAHVLHFIAVFLDWMLFFFFFSVWYWFLGRLICLVVLHHVRLVSGFNKKHSCPRTWSRDVFLSMRRLEDVSPAFVSLCFKVF